MRFQQLEYVLAAAACGNFTKAAEKVHVSQPTLSQQIKLLENEIGIPLFFRHSKSVSLTAAGQEFILYATRIVNSEKQLSEAMRQHRKQSKGVLHLGLLWIYGYLPVRHRLKNFIDEHSGIEVKITVDGSDQLIDRLLLHELDAAFVLSSGSLTSQSGIFRRKILEDRFYALVPLSNPLSSKEVIAVSDLRHENLIMPTPSSFLRKQLDYLFQKENILPQIICESHNSDIVAQLVSCGLGITFLSRAVAEALNDGGYHIIPFTPVIHRDIYFITLNDYLDYPVIQLFLEYFPENGVQKMEL